ncbi:hypothetical protein [Aequorivita echinoideorum]|uniref:Ferredoxin subunit of nitrite reductase or a ring-hydroxylating dioxygenase n=1 Tax=Aequorivita echinoideorum TaxID=1549647 RepID=A0ABS5S103_9FLAO|nr:hypothetical protein [Aequorivita echinoideorum]MBT0606886.1 hypothetical protein [Aequorivita echinoideorum]
MKKVVFAILVIFIGISCSNNDDRPNNNPFLIDPPVNAVLNLSLPEYNPLRFAGNSVVIDNGINGIVVYCVNETLYTAFELSDPNHELRNCSRMTVDGVIASCPCSDDDNEYFITSGQHTTEPDVKYPMQPYRVERNGNVITVSN